MKPFISFAIGAALGMLLDISVSLEKIATHIDKKVEFPTVLERK